PTRQPRLLRLSCPCKLYRLQKRTHRFNPFQTTKKATAPLPYRRRGDLERGSAFDQPTTVRRTPRRALGIPGRETEDVREHHALCSARNRGGVGHSRARWAESR